MKPEETNTRTIVIVPTPGGHAGRTPEADERYRENVRKRLASMEETLTDLKEQHMKLADEAIAARDEAANVLYAETALETLVKDDTATATARLASEREAIEALEARIAEHRVNIAREEERIAVLRAEHSAVSVRVEEARAKLETIEAPYLKRFARLDKDIERAERRVALFKARHEADLRLPENVDG